MTSSFSIQFFLGVKVKPVQGHFVQLRLSSRFLTSLVSLGAVCLFKETPGELKPKGRKPVGKGATHRPPTAPGWELLATTPEQLQSFGERLVRSKKGTDTRLANKVSTRSLLGAP